MGHVLTLVLLTCAAAVSVYADDPAAVAQEAIKALAAQEAAAPAGRLSVWIADRHAPFVKGEKEEETRKRLAALPARLAEGALLYGPDGWRKDYSVKRIGDPPRSVATHTSETGGEIRMLVEVSGSGVDERRGRISQAKVTAPGDAVLGHQSARALGGIQWTGAKPDGDLLTLEGRRGDERHTLVLSRSPRCQVKSWKLTRRLVARTGEQVDQEYWCDVTPGDAASGAGSVGKVEEWVLTPPPGAGISYRATEVRKAETTPAPASSVLQVRFPKGTLVTDARNEIPVEYEETEEGVSGAEVAKTAHALAEGRVKAGERAPAFSARDLKGKTVRLEDFHGKTVVLFWFSSESPAAEAAAPFAGQLFERYRKRGVQLLALDTAEAGDAAAKAEAFAKRFDWSFPVLLDTSGEAMRRFGQETGVPKVAVIDRDGTLVYVRPGVDNEAITGLLDRIVEKK